MGNKQHEGAAQSTAEEFAFTHTSQTQAAIGLRAPDLTTRSTRENSGPNDPTTKVMITNGQAFNPRSRASATIQRLASTARMTRSRAPAHRPS